MSHAQAHAIITGAKGGATQGAIAPNRLDIHDLIKNRRFFSLYIQALSKSLTAATGILHDFTNLRTVMMQATPQSSPLSHFSIAGIHGLPYVPWEGAASDGAQGSGWDGYCAHANVLFPTWHRLYVALYEVSLIFIFRT